MTTLSQALLRVRRAQAIFERELENLQAIIDVEDRLEDTIVDVAQRVGRPVLKPLRLQTRTERILAPVRTTTLFSRVVKPVLDILGRVLISGSGTFSVQELAEAQIHVFFSTERGYIAGMEQYPNRGTFYKAITKAEADELAKDLPDTHLIARLFTQEEEPDHF